MLSLILTWWLILEALGLLALPLTVTLFRSLPSRGYVLSKAVGILLAAYLFWLGVSLHIIRNTTQAIWIAMLILGAVSAATGWFAFQQTSPESRTRVLLGKR
jgi:hypothetical protein